jgi:hypothetical protein
MSIWTCRRPGGGSGTRAYAPSPTLRSRAQARPPPVLKVRTVALGRAILPYIGIRLMDDDPLLHHRQIKDRTPVRAGRQHRGPGHWHVRIRTKVIVCRACGASIPKWQNPQFCPECGAGREAAGVLP